MDLSSTYANLSNPGKLYVVGALFSQAIYLLSVLSSASVVGAGFAGLLSIVLLIAIMVGLFFLGLGIMTWIIEKLYSTSWTTLAWIVSVIMLYIHLVSSFDIVQNSAKTTNKVNKYDGTTDSMIGGIPVSAPN